MLKRMKLTENYQNYKKDMMILGLLRRFARIYINKYGKNQKNGGQSVKNSVN